MTRNRKRLSSIIFYCIYGFFVILFVGLIIFTVNKLSAFLDKYERSLEKYEAEEVYSSLFSPCRFDKLFDMQNIELGEFESKDHYVKYMENTVAGKNISYREIPAGLGDEKKYAVTADKVKFAEFILTKAKNPKFPEDTWELTSVTTFYAQNEAVSVKTYTDSILYINGKVVSDSYTTSNNLETPSCKHVPDGVNGIMQREYEIKDMLLAPTLKTINRFGKESSLVYDEKEKQYVEEISYDTITDDVKTLCENAAQTYAKYMTLDSTIYNVGKYFDTKSAIYASIKASDTRWYTPHSSYEFKNVKVYEYYKYDQNTFSIRYSCDHYVYRTANEPHLFPLDLTLYFKNINGTFYVYDMVSNY